MPTHPPLYTLPWSEVCAMGERRELIVSAEGYLLSSKDRKFDPKYAKYIWSANVDNAVHRGLLRPEDNPKGAAAPPNIKPKEVNNEQCLEETATECPEIQRVEVAASPEKAETCSPEASQVKLANAKGKPFTWSYTALSNFEGCPARYAAEKFYCTAPFVESEAIIYGNRVHTAAEQALKGQKIAEPQLLVPILPYLKAFIAQRKAGAAVTAELELALNENMQPVSWFAKDAWFRAKLDVVIETPGKLGYYDWKTGGKVKDDQDQLKICCAALSLVKPEVETYIPKLIWTKHSTVTGIEGGSLSKAEVRDVWEHTLGRVERMKQAWAAENFPARPSGLCPWCSSYDTCKYARRR